MTGGSFICIPYLMFNLLILHRVCQEKQCRQTWILLKSEIKHAASYSSITHCKINLNILVILEYISYFSCCIPHCFLEMCFSYKFFTEHILTALPSWVFFPHPRKATSPCLLLFIEVNLLYCDSFFPSLMRVPN